MKRYRIIERSTKFIIQAAAADNSGGVTWADKLFMTGGAHRIYDTFDEAFKDKSRLEAKDPEQSFYVMNDDGSRKEWYACLTNGKDIFFHRACLNFAEEHDVGGTAEEAMKFQAVKLSIPCDGFDIEVVESDLTQYERIMAGLGTELSWYERVGDTVTLRTIHLSPSKPA